jgi:uncharacterized protein YyaL (SSP411 family)
MNLLSNETSPYLLQHAANPVHWYPWGELAFAKAKEENKPVLVSIGYSSCHWCHVMEHESFEDQETADLMNKLFINIKVDREEYPDVDHMYMDAVQAMTGSGGWPLNVFITPDKKPFYGGTYFPPQRAFNRASWKEVLINVSQYFSQNREEVEKQAFQLTNHLANNSLIGELNHKNEKQDESLPEFNTEKITEKLLANADKEEGGFGSAPKFPSTFVIHYLLNEFAHTGNQQALDQALLSLDKMRMGGIYDQLGGGFSRYSTDKHWIAPHFEKMLYDNALLIDVYSIAYTITHNEEYKNTIDEIVNWLKREMTYIDDIGHMGFYSAQDADSEGVEGKYYTWDYQELKDILQENFEAFATYYNVQESGNWEHTNILFTTKKSKENQLDFELNHLPAMHQKLMSIRDKRIKPLTDDKILLGWNALMNKALSSAFIATGNQEYVSLAKRNMSFLLSKFKSSNHLYFHTYKNGEPKIPAFSDDLSYLANALIQLNLVTADTSYLHIAKDIVHYLFDNFLSKGSVLVDFTNHKFQQVQINKREIYDGAVPSPNSILADVLMKLGLFFNEIAWEAHSSQMLTYMHTYVKNHPSSFAIWARLAQQKENGIIDATIVGENAVEMFHTLYNKKYIPNVLYLITDKKDERIKMSIGQLSEGETRIGVCKNMVCHQPVNNLDEAFRLIS